ncbi:Uncharacterized protein dnl_46080 [Desulfonema limicola]|uniref:Transposase (putative) YhgA-like domain-containing protein n=1 Tax=Desulfonema limicola TaxID=45656 RepID=A0A975BBJ7_9BACT|nr:hypothetical protein [Desulfonema limicola]QTA82231.1 Uncharacterized protein dnl_46040 [Desulfonema limicola]QTA82235.1 Uncharacterized protein dnl_46080 [Desulfonema limicola]
MKNNPKTHDALFKWLITSFTEEFFAHYFPEIEIGQYRFIDKEFISKYEALKESLKGDLFLVMEIEIDGQLRETVIQIEHQSQKEDMSKRVFKYACYAWLLKEKPVWSIVIYTDEAVWRKQMPDSFWFGFDRVHKKQLYYFDVIKVKAEKSADLIKKHSLMCKLLALKADDKGTDPEKLIYEIYLAADQMKDKLTNDQLLLIEQWINAYKKVPDKALESIKKEVKMDMIATTISEHIFLEGKNKGRSEGKAEGKTEGKIEGKIEILENLFLQKILTREQFEKAIEPLRQQLKELME